MRRQHEVALPAPTGGFHETELFENWGRVQEINGRSGGIRTHDPLTPSQVRYRAALRSDLPKRLVSFIVSSPQMQAQNAGAGIKMTRRRGKLAQIRRKRPSRSKAPCCRQGQRSKFTGNHCATACPWWLAREAGAVATSAKIIRKA